MRGTVTLSDKGNVRVHSYMAPYDGLNVTTQLIETPGLLIAVDAPVAVTYAKGLGKPLDRIVITHAQPGHFQDGPLQRARSRTAGLREQLAARGDLDPALVPVPAGDHRPAADPAARARCAGGTGSRVIPQDFADPAYGTILSGYGLPAGPAVFACLGRVRLPDRTGR